MNVEELSNICMNLISYAGEGRNYVFEALRLATQKDYSNANLKILEAEKYLSEAHRIQFEELMVPQAKGEEIPFSLLLLHAMDLLMIAISEKDLVATIINDKKTDA
ncbi:PTS lactose/cellobiose transporter subunit IIA [Tepidimicrobium xylanilyticum]|uniref:PTS lactose/cellobiose transporter subunit IIA n=1 Tax=Tepidimicrobium xylanilyticum TaxID=1123352 RepID=UPI00264F7ACD|nr:PTS lactose/cellobiose transporter subunit IIA [Tepidimicrobium xylanilyticum]GMG97772.1 PTS lactose transporter subunit IIA [Tepidimicrobium xylanilyticum]